MKYLTNIQTPEAFNLERKKFTESIFKYLDENNLDVLIYNIKKILDEKMISLIMCIKNN